MEKYFLLYLYRMYNAFKFFSQSKKINFLTDDAWRPAMRMVWVNPTSPEEF